MLYGIYLTGYWWGWDKILYRCLVSFLFLLGAIFVGTFITVWIRNLRGYFQMKKNRKQSGLPVSNEKESNNSPVDSAVTKKEP